MNDRTVVLADKEMEMSGTPYAFTIGDKVVSAGVISNQPDASVAVRVLRQVADELERTSGVATHEWLRGLADHLDAEFGGTSHE